MALPSPKTPVPLPIEIPSDLQTVYANLARISHAPAEFVLDMARFLPGDTKATVAARIVMSPVALKLFVQALNENLTRYEATFGTINIPSGSSSSLADHLFRSHQPPEPPKDPPIEPK